jgi:beta-galactosidase
MRSFQGSRGALLVVAMVMTATDVHAQHTPLRQSVNLDTGWGYLERSDADVHALDVVPSTAWRSVDLPHTWNARDATDLVPGYRRGASWYRRMLDVHAYPAGSRLRLRFDGASTVADVYVNGRRMGGHVGGYVGFVVDITDQLRRSGANELRVRVDNSDDAELIPSRRSDFVIYGGLTRDVWLEVVPPVFVQRLEVRTPEVSRASARTAVRVEIGNPTGARGTYALEAALSDAQGRLVAQSNASVSLGGDSLQSVAIEPLAVNTPSLWSPATPTLYRLAVTLTREGKPIDRAGDRVGFRWYRFEPHGPFFLNGERLLIRGTQRHEDDVGVGGALPVASHRRDLAEIKAMGANFVRLAHYPQHPEVYRAADSLGLLVWDELPWDRGGVGGEEWRARTRRLLREQIRQNSNHPSIILWSLGNEVQDLIEPQNAGDTPTLRKFMEELKAIARELDPARPVATRKFDAGADVLDVYSPSIWAGWYAGVYRGYEQALLQARAKFTGLLHMEYGGDALYGRHSESPITGDGMRLDPGTAEAVGVPMANIARDGDWSESYQTDLLDWHLTVSERLEWFAGNAQWVFKDFATPLRPDNPIPYVNMKGLLTRDGKRKDSYYVFRSFWTTSPRFVYIVSHSWTERSGPKGKPRAVRVYSNCSDVELLMSGVSQGRRHRVRDDFPSQGLRWDVSFADGMNAIAAHCAGAGEGGTSDSLRVNYTSEPIGRPVDIVLTSRPLPNGHLLVEARLVDAKGHTSVAAADRMFFDHDGDGRLVVDEGTPTGSQEIQAANGYAAIELVPPTGAGHATVGVRTQALNGAVLRLTFGTKR